MEREIGEVFSITCKSLKLENVQVKVTASVGCKGCIFGIVRPLIDDNYEPCEIDNIGNEVEIENMLNYVGECSSIWRTDRTSVTFQEVKTETKLNFK